MQIVTCRILTCVRVRLFYYGDADQKSSYLYENLPVQTKMTILSRRPILLAIFVV